MSEEAAGFSASLRQLRDAQKSAAGAPLYSIVVNRPLGRIFAAGAHQAHLTPNIVTAISAVFTYAGIVLLALGTPGWGMGVGVAALLVIGYALDSSDGQLARLRGGGSLLGEWLDHVIDSGKVVSIHLAVLVMAYRNLTPEWWMIVPLVMTIVSVVHFFGMLLTELLARASGQPKSRPRTFSPVSAALKLPTDYGILCVCFVLLGVPGAFQVVYSVLTVCTAAYTALVLVVWARRVHALDVARSSATGS